MKKILYILHYTDIYGGAHKSFLSMLQIVRKQYEITVLVPAKTGIYYILKDLRVSVVVFPFQCSVYPSSSKLRQKIVFLPRLLFYLVENYLAKVYVTFFVFRNHIDLIHSNVTVVDIGYKVSIKTKIPHIWHVREYGDLDFGLTYFPSNERFHKMLSKSYSLCITEGVKKHHGLTSNYKTRVVYNPIVLPLSKIDITSKQNFFLYVGRLTNKKGVDDLVNAFILFYKTLPQNDFILVLIGEGQSAYVDSLRKLLFENNLTDKVEFLGKRDDLSHYYKTCFATIVPSHFEGFGRVPVEAMLCGSLVIGHDKAGIKEQFDNGRKYIGSEIALRYNDVSELSDLLIVAVNNGIEYYSDMIHRGQDAAQHLYSEELYANNIFNMYSDVLGENA